jgi:CheY-like chemotaxis protein
MQPYAVRVMVVDDDMAGTAMLMALLELKGYAVRSSHDGLHALPAILAWQPRVVLLDIDLPGRDGFDLARCLRREPIGEGLLLIAITGWTRPEDREIAALCGIDYFLAKPLDTDALLALLPPV